MSNDPEPAPPATAEGQKRFPCGQCGAQLQFQPGSTALKCEYCGFENPIPQSDVEIQELDYQAHLARLAETKETQEHTALKCDACGAEIDKPATVEALSCPFCGTHIVATAKSRRLLKPQSLLPFKLASAEARTLYKQWLRTRWFAPGALKLYARQEQSLRGLYVPYWTYDSQTISRYTGQRGEHYYVTVGSGKNQRRERRTRWYPASGVVRNSFNDILVLASRSLPREYTDQLEPWDLANLTAYEDAYLSGFTAENYQIELGEGFETAKTIMDERIRESVRRDIGGDEQRILSVQTQYNDITFKHLLLPVWLSAYRFRDKTYRFLVNARTGEVQGERPYSWIKITLFVLTLLTLVAAVVWFIVSRQ